LGTALGTGWDGVSDLLYFQRLQPASKNLVSSIPTVSTMLVPEMHIVSGSFIDWLKTTGTDAWENEFEFIKIKYSKNIKQNTRKT
jgi:hypothetical protein